MGKLALIAIWSGLTWAAPHAPQREGPTSRETFKREDLIRQAKEIQKEVAELRGWEFKHAVPTDVYDEAQLRQFIEKKLFDEQLGGGRLQLLERFLHTVGLLPAGCDYRETVMTVLLNQVGGFYDTDSKSFKMMQRGPSAEIINAVLVAHELTHALDDQYFDLEKYVKLSLASEDVGLAIASLVEGSATELMSRYMQIALAKGEMDTDEMGAWMQAEMERSETFIKAPSYFTTLMASYVMGMQFVLRGDMGAISDPQAQRRISADLKAAFADPPRSSEQILHPEKYWDSAQRDDPVALDDAEFEREILRDLGQVIHRNTVGEILAALLTMPPDRPFDMVNATVKDFWTNDAARGWGGDRFFLLDGGDAKAETGRGVWITLWDTPGDRTEFMEDYAAHRKSANQTVIPVGSRGVAYTFGLTPEHSRLVAERLGKATLRATQGTKPWTWN